MLRWRMRVNAAPLQSPMSSGSGFDDWLRTQGPHTADGRSLRELDLTTRLFRYPVSYLIYSEAFDALPHPIKDYVYGRLESVLSGRDTDAAFGSLPPALRAETLQILRLTKRGFAR